MSGRAKSVHTYPREFWNIVEGCANRGEVYEREVDGWQTAMRFQGKFYAFRGAVKREIALMGLRPDQYTREQVIEMENLLQACLVTVCWFDRRAREGPVMLRFLPQDKTEDAEILRGFQLVVGPPALGGGPGGSGDAEESEARVLERLKDETNLTEKYK